MNPFITIRDRHRAARTRREVQRGHTLTRAADLAAGITALHHKLDELEQRTRP